MDVEFRPLRPEDLEQAVHVEATAFYNEPRPNALELLQRLHPLTWTVGGFVDGRLVADVRTTPMARRINGKSIPYGTVGPGVCLAEPRRRGYVGRLLRLSLEWMHEHGLPLAGLHTPHDALYQRYGWERAESKKGYSFHAKDIRLRIKGEPGRLEPVQSDGWQRLEEVYRRYAGPRNGPLHRPEVWWREAILRDYDSGRTRDAFLWVSDEGGAQGYVIYTWRGQPWQPGLGGGHALAVRDMVSVTADAYVGLWQHLLGHDLARPIVVDVAANDPFVDLVDDPWKVEVRRSEGAMIRIVDVEQALGARPYVGEATLAFTMRVVDP